MSIDSSITPKALYKYRPFNDYTLQLLDQTEVYYANPQSFNDPIDSNPNIIQDLDLPQLERLFLTVAKASFGEQEATSQISRLRYMSTEYGNYKTDPDTRQYYLNNLASSLIRLLRKDMGTFGVLSLASKWNCPLMWSHYADEHRGLCIEYSITDTTFSKLGKVKYNGSRSIKLSDVFAWRVKKCHVAEESVRTSMYFSKAPVWRYEREWRDLQIRPGVYPAPALPSAVLFGYRCSHTIIRVVIRLFAQASFPVRFYSVRPMEDSFRLKRHALNANDILSEGVPLPDGWEFREAFFDESQS